MKKFIWNYLSAINSNQDLSFVLALDGDDSEYIEFCNKFDIPLIYSEEREGVGLSKNRVITQFPNFDYYFFIDDDVELLNKAVFMELVEVMKKQNIHHLCANERHEINDIETLDRAQIVTTVKAGGYFTAYSRIAIDKIGGWHPHFAKYKRFGHSEHSYRTVFSGLQKSPFIFIANQYDSILLHSPPSVTEIEEELIKDELEMIEKKQDFHPIVTLSNFHFNQKPIGFNQKANEFLESNSRKYPLTDGKERRNGLAEHYFLKMKVTKSNSQKVKFFFKSIFNNPLNTPFKHWVKQKLRLT